MSSLGAAKCTNSAALASSGVAGDTFLDEILDGLDVVVGRALDGLDARGVVFGEIVRDREECARAAGENGAISPMPSAAASASSQRTSTSTRRFIRPYSLKIGRRFSTFAA